MRGGDLDVVHRLDRGEQLRQRFFVLEGARRVHVERRLRDAEEDELRGTVERDDRGGRDLAVVAVAGADLVEGRSRPSARSGEADADDELAALEPGELVVRVRFPAPRSRSGAAFHEVSARYRDYCQVAAAAVVSLDGTADLVLLRVAQTPFHIDVSSVLEDEGALEGLLAGIEPEDDIEVSAAHRRRVAPVLARRALREATENARRKEAA
jgi:CO/xanthine dehydrogenase FAD-binding subunit